MLKREYRGEDFSVLIQPVFREAVSVIYANQTTSLKLDGELIGNQWEAISVGIPASIEQAQLPKIVSDLESAFAALRIGYEITRQLGVDIVPESERQAALAELREMGYEIELLPNGGVRQSRRTDALPQDIETVRKQAPRMMSLLRAVHGTRPRIEMLAKSRDL